MLSYITVIKIILLSFPGTMVVETMGQGSYLGPRLCNHLTIGPAFKLTEPNSFLANQ